MSTYRASGNVVAVAGVAPFLNIAGAVGKVIRVKRIVLSGFTLTAVAYLRAVITKYSAAPTGGTPVEATEVKLDSNDADTAGAVVRHYTAAPTPGAVIGDVAERTVLGQATTAVAAGVPVDSIAVIEFPTPIPLRGVAENLSARFGANPATAVTLSYDIEWTEDGN